MRQYIVFGSNDGGTWVQLGVVEASGHTQAMGQFRERANYQHYGSCPLRNWASATPQIKQRAPVVTWEPLGGNGGDADHWKDSTEGPPEPQESPAQAARRLREDLAVEERA